MGIIETKDDLRDWFLMLKLPVGVASNPYAMEAWGKALKEPTRNKIWVFYVMAGMNRYLPEQIKWQLCD